MILLKYTKSDLVNFFKLNISINNIVIKLKTKNNIKLKVYKNLNNPNYKYQITIYKNDSDIFLRNGNNYTELLEQIHNFLINKNLILKEEISSYNEEEIKVDKDIFENKKINIQKTNQVIFDKKLNPKEFILLKQELHDIFTLNKEIEYDSLLEDGEIHLYSNGKRLKDFEYSNDYIKQFLVQYLLILPQKIQSNKYKYIPEAIHIYYNNNQVVNIYISNFLNNFEEQEKFEEANKNNDSLFNLCDSDLYVSEPSLNCFIENLFFEYKIKIVKGIYIS